MLQLSLPLNIDEKSKLLLEESFVIIPENYAAQRFLKKFFTQDNFSIDQFSSIILKGETSCGKSHMLNIFAKKYGAYFVDNKTLNEINPINFFDANKFYIIENIHEIKDEESLLRIINGAYENSAFLALSSNYDYNFKLKDLTSRLKNIFSVEIKNPSKESVKQLLINGFAIKQLRFSSNIIDEIIKNIDTKYSSVMHAIKLVEFYCNNNSKNINMQQVSKILNSIN